MSAGPPADNDSRRDDRFSADGSTPWVSAYVLSQTVFSPRAGLITHELARDDDGQEGELQSPRLDWEPDYDEVDVNLALQRRWDEVWWVCTYGLWWLSFCLVIFFVYEPILACLLAAPVLVFVPWAWRQALSIVILDSRRRAAARAPKLDISDLGRQERVVNWWSLRKAGFTKEKRQEANVDRQWRLAGKPFLILRYQSLRIPVVRKHRGEHVLHSQNRARVAAYCHLIEATEGASAPFGVFIFAGSYDVHIIPNDARNQSIFRRGLSDTREVLKQASAGELPAPPAGNQCSGCPFGFPRVYVAGKTDSHLDILPGSYSPRRGADGREYHSICGDRFEWRPPHDRAIEKELDE